MNMKKKKKDLVRELKKYNIPFVMDGENYILWPEYNHLPYSRYKKSCTEREVWKIISGYRHKNRPWSGKLKEMSNSKERARLRENLHHELFERAEVRENKDNPWNWD